MHIENHIILFVYTLAHLWYNRNTYYEGKMGDIMDTLAKDFFVEDFIGDREDVLRSIELLQMELDNFVNQHTDEDLQEAAPEVQNEVGYLLYTLGKSF